MIEMRIVDLRQDHSEQNVVWLQSVEGSVMVPIEIGPVEYRSIRSELAGKSMPRPLAYDLMCAMLEHFDAEVEKVQIVDLKDQIFFAELILFARGEQVRLDARPSDSIVLALKFDAPIYMDAKIIQQVGFKVNRTKYGYELKQLNPPQEPDFSEEPVLDIAQATEQPIEGIDSRGQDIDPDELLEILKEQMNKAVKEERYEDAGMIRDEIERIEEKSET
ncbi:MAG: bifunctional nuclease family protein [Candidatus Latescibacteria bacterium]|nr:bifunctional nuclease family protein [Candidatus Latescibacterota bacterium]